MKLPVESASWIESVIRDFVETSPENTLKNAANDRAFDAPLVGFSSGADPLYLDFKTHVGEFHWTPAEAFAMAFPSTKIDPGEISVISWVLPQTASTKSDNRKERVYPSESWARNRMFGQEFLDKVGRHLVEKLTESGVEAFDPLFLPEWKIEKSERFTFSSRWSERHAAYVSGLGTFGLCDGLITPVGKAVRIGSVIARIDVPPSSRPYRDYREYCLFHAKGTCGKCIGRCPVRAVTEQGHDKIKCRRHSIDNATKYVKSNFGFDGYGCGLCQTAVPCESGIPVTDDDDVTKGL